MSSNIKKKVNVHKCQIHMHTYIHVKFIQFLRMMYAYIRSVCFSFPFSKQRFHFNNSRSGDILDGSRIVIFFFPCAHRKPLYPDK